MNQNWNKIGPKLEQYWNIYTDTIIEIDGELDLQGFLGLKTDINPGFPELKFIFHVQGNGTQEQYEKLMERVRMHSPNYNTIKNEVRLIGTLQS